VPRPLGGVPGRSWGATAAAVLYSLIGAYKHYDIDRFAYLTDILSRLPSRPAGWLGELLPDAWLASHRHARLKVAS
jgi:hypothetical protein